jgi:hypothetical protein
MMFTHSNSIGKREPDYKEIVDCIGQELVK